MTDSSAQLEITEAPTVPTLVVQAHDYPMDQMPALFDSTFRTLYPALAERGVDPAGAAFSLHHRMPSESADLEVGVPVATALTEPITVGDVVLTPSTLPAGTVATTSYHGPYEGLGEAWGAFMNAIAEAGREPVFPLWEVYVTQPTPDTDPATLRTDLFTLVTPATDG